MTPINPLEGRGLGEGLPRTGTTKSAKEIIHARLCGLYGSATSIGAQSILSELQDAGYIHREPPPAPAGEVEAAFRAGYAAAMDSRGVEGSWEKYTASRREPQGGSAEGRECWILAYPNGTFSRQVTAIPLQPGLTADQAEAGFRWIRMVEATPQPAPESKGEADLLSGSPKARASLFGSEMKRRGDRTLDGSGGALPDAKRVPEGQWISLKERRPPAHENVLVAGYDGKVHMYYLVPEKPGYCWGWYPGGWPFENATHWMPLPKSPLKDAKRPGEVSEPEQSPSPLPSAEPSNPDLDLEAGKEIESWSVKDWSEWAYHLGIKLDRWIPLYGMDNAQRIAAAIGEFVRIKKTAPAPADGREG